MAHELAPLAGIRVLDLSRVFAGPVAGRVLGDLGADVVKVEPPDGDVTRHFGAPTAGITTYFAQQNVGKRNISIDFNADGGPDLVRRLVVEADVVVENFRPGVLARFGLDYETLRQIKPDLVMLSISGFGQTGPEVARAAYAPIIHAETGVVHADRSDAASTKDVAFSAADVLSGMHGVIAVLAALRMRDQHGIGQHIDMAMVDAMIFSSDANDAVLDDRPADRDRGGRVFDAVGGPVMLSGEIKWFWHVLSATHGLSDPGPKDRSIAEKKADRERIIGEWMMAQPDRSTLIERLDEANLAWGDLRQRGQVAESPTLVHRGTIVEIDDRDGGTRKVTQAPYVMSESPERTVGAIALRGEHNFDVLGDWLDVSLAEADELIASGVLLCDEWAAQLTDQPGSASDG